MENKKSKLIKILLDDFIKDFPESNRATRVEVFSRLQGFEVSELELLVSQVKKENEK
jgi:hypothetical protein